MWRSSTNRYRSFAPNLPAAFFIRLYNPIYITLTKKALNAFGLTALKFTFLQNPWVQINTRKDSITKHPLRKHMNESLQVILHVTAQISWNLTRSAQSLKIIAVKSHNEDHLNFRPLLYYDYSYINNLFVEPILLILFAHLIKPIFGTIIQCWFHKPCHSVTNSAPVWEHWHIMRSWVHLKMYSKIPIY